MKKKNEPKLWLTVLKLVLGLVFIVGGVTLALWFALQHERMQTPAGGGGDGSWGIVNDSPLRKKF
ncbi:MAG: hypothetical protein ACR2I0_09970 [Rhodoferax sp.]